MNTAVINAAPSLDTELAQGLRALADMVEANPELAPELRWALGKLYAPVSPNRKPKKLISEFIRAAKAHGAKVFKRSLDKHSGVDLFFGPVGVWVYADRNLVCERKVIGTKKVIDMVPDPVLLAAVPTIEVTRDEDVVTWICPPYLEAVAKPVNA